MTTAQHPGAAISLLHLYADASGDSCFGTIEVTLALRDFAPPATPFEASQPRPAAQYLIIRLPAGWIGRIRHRSRKFCSA